MLSQFFKKIVYCLVQVLFLPFKLFAGYKKHRLKVGIERDTEYVVRNKPDPQLLILVAWDFYYEGNLTMASELGNKLHNQFSLQKGERNQKQLVESSCLLGMVSLEQAKTVEALVYFKEFSKEPFYFLNTKWATDFVIKMRTKGHESSVEEYIKQNSHHYDKKFDEFEKKVFRRKHDELMKLK
jgi:hypothetical protein